MIEECCLCYILKSLPSPLNLNFLMLSTLTLLFSTVILTHDNRTQITTCDNDQINLFCEGRLDTSSGDGNITWYKQGDPVTKTNQGHLLSQTHLTGSLSLHPASFLTILALDGTTDGRYSCEVWYPHQVEKERVYFDITVESKFCLCFILLVCFGVLFVFICGCVMWKYAWETQQDPIFNRGSQTLAVLWV